jgi:alanine dehydrogenase
MHAGPLAPDLRNESRVSLVPGGVKALVDNRHQVLVQAGAGLGSGITDEEYRAGKLTCAPVAEAQGLTATPLADVLRA